MKHLLIIISAFLASSIAFAEPKCNATDQSGCAELCAQRVPGTCLYVQKPEQQQPIRPPEELKPAPDMTGRYNPPDEKPPTITGSGVYQTREPKLPNWELLKYCARHPILCTQGCTAGDNRACFALEELDQVPDCAGEILTTPIELPFPNPPTNCLNLLNQLASDPYAGDTSRAACATILCMSDRELDNGRISGNNLAGNNCPHLVDKFFKIVRTDNKGKFSPSETKLARKAALEECASGVDMTPYINSIINKWGEAEKSPVR